MKKFFTLLVALLTAFTTVGAQSSFNGTFPIEISSGLTDGYIIGQYYWDSPMYSMSEPIDGVRITFKETTNGEYNGFPLVAIAELTFYDRNMNVIEYSIDDVECNSLEGSEGSLNAINDGNWDTYYHSAWKDAIISPDDYVYIDVKFMAPVSNFGITMVSRNTSTAPTTIVITRTGEHYSGSVGEDGDDTGGADTGGDTEIEWEPVDVLNDSICFVYLSNGGVDAYQKSFMEQDAYIEEGILILPLKDGSTVTYAQTDYDSCTFTVPQLPTMISYKFNNKYNPNLNTDIETDTVKSEMQFRVNAIGKSLTASFNLSDDRAVAYVDTTLQTSKESRLRFDAPVHYIVTYPGYNIVQNVKVKDEIWDYGEENVEEIKITASMLYTNKPSEVGDALSNMLDGDAATVFHSVYGANYDASVLPYITITLDEAVENIRFYYMTRTFGNYNPRAINIYVSDNGEHWTLVDDFTSDKDGLPLDPPGAEYTSPTINLGGNYRHIKIEQTASEYHNNHMVFAEFRLYNVTPGSGEPTKVQDAEYKTIRIPFGRIYTINTTWPADDGIVPRIDINVEDNRSITSKDYYLRAQITITGNGMYDDFQDSVNVKGRGNSTWGYPKKPYRLKFDEKCKPFGLTKGKSWVLLANYQRGSMMANAIAMKIGQLIESPYANHIIPVDLYVNGEYKGSYMFTEHVGFSNNSVDIDEDLGTGYMLELDDYYDEDYKFRSENYSLPVNIKEPDLTELPDDKAMEYFYNIQGDFNRFESSVYENGSLSVLDVDAAARFMLTNDLVLNQELGHPKSTFLWREDMTSADSKITFGPIWDFDWAFGYESTSSYCHTGATSSIFHHNMSTKAGSLFFQDLMNNEIFKRHYYKVWKEFIEKGHLQELVDYLDDYYNFAKNSFMNNYMEWYDNITADDIERMQNWLSQRHDHIARNIEEYDITDLIHTLHGDVDCNDVLTVHDVAITVSHILGDVVPDLSVQKADADGNGKVNTADVENIASQVAAAEPVPSVYWYYTPVAASMLSADECVLSVDERAELSVNMSDFGTVGYKAVQMDFKVPMGVAVLDAVGGERVANHEFIFNQTGEDSYRIVIYSKDNNLFAAGNLLATLSLNVVELLPEELRRIEISNVLAIDDENNEVRLGDYSAHFDIVTGISSEVATESVRGGNTLKITSLVSNDVNIYSVDGRLVRTLRVDAGTVEVQLPAGVYVVNGKKVIIY